MREREKGAKIDRKEGEISTKIYLLLVSLLFEMARTLNIHGHLNAKDNNITLNHR